jgi:hypothetical protein
MAARFQGKRRGEAFCGLHISGKVFHCAGVLSVDTPAHAAHNAAAVRVFPSAIAAFNCNFPAIAVELTGINNLGDTVGTYYDSSDTVHGFLLKNGSVENIDCPGQPSYVLVNAVNGADTFVGACYYSGFIIQGFYGTP